jgi:hypothetical protein
MADRGVEGDRTGGAPSEATGERTRDESEAERLVRCAACGHGLARPRDAFSVNGATEHEFMNPSGLRFVVRCFSKADGAREVGESSDVWTWFPGYAWTPLACGACHAHVGWSFRAPEKAFFALIADRIAD